MKKHLGWFFWVIVLSLIVCFPLMSNIVKGNPDELTNSPSINWQVAGNWINPANAYSSNNVYTYASISGQKWAYGNYSFNLSDNDTITKVEVGLEGYLDSGEIGYYVSWDNGSVWNFIEKPFDSIDPEFLYWHDVTSFTSWNNTLLDNDHLATMIYYQSISGCYGLDAEVGLWEGGIKKVRDVQIGDILTGWNVSELEIKGEFEDWNITNFEPATVLNVTIHSGEWDVLRIIVESVYRAGDFKDVLVTPDHILPYYKVDYEPDGSLDKIELQEKQAKDFGENDYVFGFIEASVNWTTLEEIPAHFEPYKFHNVTSTVVDGVADIQTDVKWFMGHYMLRIKLPWTGYVDWIPVRVNYTPEEEEIIWDTNYIGINNTIISQVTLFSADWTDLNQSEGLSHYRFQTNNTGILVNDTWTDFWVNQNWTQATKTLNSTVGLIIAFRFYANDSSGIEHKSTVSFFETQTINDYSIVFLAIGLSVGFSLMVVGVKIKK